MVQKGALTFVMMVAFAIPFVLFTGVAEGQMVVNSTLTGTILSASAHNPGFEAPGPPVPIFTVPQGGSFILTQLCLTHEFEPPTVSGNTFGKIGSTKCLTYTPGLLLSPGEILVCGDVVQFSALTCTITGVLSNR